MPDVTLSGFADGLHLYNALRDEYPKSLGPRNWLGNLRWIAVEQSDPLSFIFRTCPTDESEAEFSHAGNTLPCARRTLFGLKIEGVEGITKFVYRADGMEVGSASADLSLILPLNDYGAILSVVRKDDHSPLRFAVKTSAAAGRLPVHETQIQIESKRGLVAITDGAYTIAFRHDGEFCALGEGGFEIRNLPPREVRLAIAFHVSRDIALDEANRLFERADDALFASRQAWQEYLASCPVVRFDKDYTYYNAFLGRQITFAAREIFERQLWHWYCVLMNVYHIDFNRMSASIYPEKNGWMGVWSNDSPESMRALAHTGRKDLARDCLQQYIRYAINDEGDHSWYTHGTGIGCIGNPGDSGRLSHGVPAIVNAVAEYVRESGDIGFLDSPAGEKWTVWTKLKHYMETVFQRRDINGDGLVEWTQLWEGGADDKVGPFFSSAGLREWIDAAHGMTDDDYRAFHATHCRPVVNLYEQAWFLDACLSMEYMATLRGESALAKAFKERYEHVVRVLETRHWDEESGFYYDWDMHGDCLVKVPNQDAFYLLKHLHTPERAARVMEHFDDPEEFGLCCTPTLARNAAGFRPNGYWSGGYWPRESNYIAAAFDAAGYHEKALEVVLKALCSDKGKLVRENMSPLTGKDNTGVTTLAYSALLNVVLYRICAEGVS